MAQEYKGKSVYKGIVLGPIAVFKKNDVQVKREKSQIQVSEIARSRKQYLPSQEQLQKLYDKAVKEVGEASAADFWKYIR
ncbi:MAG: phosphoenolpyruvate-utilizing N-terminal domain-containing protein [Eubacterium ramulus]